MCQSRSDKQEAKKTSTEEVAVTVVGKPPKLPSLRQLYRFADGSDVALLILGSCVVFITGCNQPLQLVVFGRLMDSFNSADADEVKARVHLFAGLYALLGLMQMVTNSVQSSCFATVAARQAKRMRIAYFSKLARQPMSFFDAPGRDAGALASSVMDKAMHVQIGIGDDLVKLMQQLACFTLGICFALFFCWQVALVAMGSVPCIGLVVVVANKAYTKATSNSASILDKAT